jgi:fatty acid desaturase
MKEILTGGAIEVVSPQSDIPQIKDVLSEAELKGCLARSNWRASLVLLANFAMIAGAFAVAIIWPNPATMLFSVLVLGARQLGLEVLKHDCAHGIFFSARRVNEMVGHWLCGGLMNSSLYRYRDYHLRHHRFAGTEKDPDLYLAQMYPVARDSMRRKLLRDLTGRTGIRNTWRELRGVRLQRNAPFLVTHVAMFSVLAGTQAPWAYLLWWAGYIFCFPLITRIRYMGEHGVCLDYASADPRENTSSTIISWWERLFIAPNRVNYHLEHHLMAGVPLYRLRGFHRLLRSRGFFSDKDCFSHGYAEVIGKAMVPA